MRVVIVGVGIAGLSAALSAADEGDEVTLITKEDNPYASASSWAQGGVAYRGYDDSSDFFFEDIRSASGGMANEKIAQIFASEAPGVLKEILIDRIKVPFQQEGGEFLFTEEAIHSRRRILFSGDNTGEVVIKHLMAAVGENPRIHILPSHMAVDLINIPHHSKNPLSVYEESRCVGVYVFDQTRKEVIKIFSDKIILATGGIGRLYLHSTNPPGATGDGIAIASRAGARIINMEFTQFHPTTLAVKEAAGFLISEAMRGEGAVLVNIQGEEFMDRYDARGSLSPRDVVARAIIQEQIRTGSEYMYLSLKKSRFDFPKRFPKIYSKCVEHALDVDSPTFKGIPITPAFHYSCGGIFTDAWGRTTIKNLFAVGENACTGIHGANRLASTSLLEGVFFGHRAAKFREVNRDKYEVDDVREWEESPDSTSEVDPVMIKKDFAQLQTVMWNYAGIIRRTSYLSSALEELQFLKVLVEARYRSHKLGRDILELKNAVQTAFLIVDSAIKNRTSMGCHYLLD